MPRKSSVVSREMRAIHTSFRRLARSFSVLAPLLGEGAMSMARVQEDTRRVRRQPRLSRKQRAALKLQGKYMGTMRGLPAAKRAKVKKIRSEKGIMAAIRAAERMRR